MIFTMHYIYGILWSSDVHITILCIIVGYILCHSMEYIFDICIDFSAVPARLGSEPAACGVIVKASIAIIPVYKNYTITCMFDLIL